MFTNCFRCGNRFTFAERKCCGEKLYWKLVKESNPWFLVSLLGQARPRTGYLENSQVNASEKLSLFFQRSPVKFSRGLSSSIPTMWPERARKVGKKSFNSYFHWLEGGLVWILVNPPEKRPYSAR